jgi:hypothetical protein
MSRTNEVLSAGDVLRSLAGTATELARIATELAVLIASDGSRCLPIMPVCRACCTADRASAKLSGQLDLLNNFILDRNSEINLGKECSSNAP